MFGSEIGTSLVILREKLGKIKRTERHTIIRNPGSKYAAQAIDERADMIFQVGTDEHSIRFYTSANLPEAELDWLAYEISNFWKLSITKEPFEIVSE
ncbi:MAG: hypothetical protein AAF229_05800 [Pseudomonadota bacterium]